MTDAPIELQTPNLRSVAISRQIADAARPLIQAREAAERRLESADALAHTFLFGVCLALGEDIGQLRGVDPDTLELLFEEATQEEADAVG